MRVKCLRTTLRTLKDEAAYVANDDPEAARTVVQRALEAVDAC